MSESLTGCAGLAEAATAFAAATFAVACGTVVLGGSGEVGGKIALAVNLATADPDLHADHTDLGVSLNQCVVDVGTQGVERCTAFLEHFGAGHFGAVQTARNLNLDTLGTRAHCCSHGHLHGTAVSHLAFDLAGDVACHNLGVEFGTLHLEDVDLNILVGDFLEFFLELVNLSATLADDHAGTRCAHGDGDEFECTLDNDAGNA